MLISAADQSACRSLNPEVIQDNALLLRRMSPFMCWFLDAGNEEAPQAQLAGVQKAPRHEVAGSAAPGRATSAMRVACRRGFRP